MQDRNSWNETPWKGKRGEEKLLEGRSVFELKQMISQICDHFPGVLQFITFQYAVEEQLVAGARNLMKRFLSLSLDDEKILPEHARLAVEGGEIVLEKANASFSSGRFSLAVELYLLILSTYLPYLKDCTDVDGVFGFLIDRCINGVHNAMLQVAKSEFSLEEKRAVFCLVRAEVEKRIYDDWIDWRADLLQSCVCLCEDREIRMDLEQTVDHIIDSLPNNHNYRQFVGAQLKEIVFSIVQAFDSDLDIQSFILNNVRYDHFRELALQLALEKSNFLLVFNLANAPRWRPYVYEAYKAMGEREGQIRIGEELILEGQPYYYPELKSLFSQDEWIEERDLLLDLLEEQIPHPPVYLDILLKEGLTERILRYLEEEPSVIMEAYPFLYQVNPEETKRHFNRFLDVLQTHLKKGKWQTSEGIRLDLLQFFSLYLKLFGLKETECLVNMPQNREAADLVKEELEQLMQEKRGEEEYEEAHSPSDASEDASEPAGEGGE